MSLGNHAFPPDSNSDRKERDRSRDRSVGERGEQMHPVTDNRDIGGMSPGDEEYLPLQDQQRMLMGPSVNDIQKAQQQLSPGFATAGAPYENTNHRYYSDRMPPMRGVGSENNTSRPLRERSRSRSPTERIVDIQTEDN